MQSCKPTQLKDDRYAILGRAIQCVPQREKYPIDRRWITATDIFKNLPYTGIIFILIKILYKCYTT